MNMKTLIVLIFLATVTAGIKVNERFKGNSFNTNVKCKVLSFSPPKQEMSQAINVIFRNMNDFFTGGFTRFNSCVIDDSIEILDMGELINPETGEYSGITGQVQRDEFQSAGTPYNAASRPSEPVKVGPAVMPADLALISFRPRRVDEAVQLEQFIYEFDHITYAYIALAVIHVSLCMAMVMYLHAKMRLKNGRKISMRKFTRKSVENFYDILMLLLNQLLIKKLSEANKYIWISVVIFVFVLIFNLFLSLIRSSYVVTRQPPYIESFQDLVESNVTPVTFRGVHYEDTFRLSTRKDYQHIYERLTAKGSNNFITSKFDFDPDMMERSRPIFNKIRDRKAAFIIDAVYVQFWKSGLCNFVPIGAETYGITAELMTRFTSTREYFAPGILATMFSPKIDPFLYKYVHFYYRTSVEFGMFIKLMHDAKYTRYFGDQLTAGNLTMCVDSSEKVVEDIDDHKQLNVDNIRNFLYMIARLLGLSLGVLMIEILIYWIIEGKNMIKRKRKFEKVATWTLVNPTVTKSN